MPEELDAEIIQAAYAERVKETFKVLAENLGMGQNEKSSRERFVRSLELLRKAREMALDSMQRNVVVVEPTAASPAAADSAQAGQGDGLSAEEQGMVDRALAETTGHRPGLRR